MIVRLPDRPGDPGLPAEQLQPDPMLQERHNAGPIAIGMAALFAVLVVGVLFYGLNNGRQETIATEGVGAISTSGSAATGGNAASTEASAPASTDKGNSGA